jgi:DNA repair exonuclease SbcCD ATPase subunit
MQKAFEKIIERLEEKRAELESITAECRHVPKEFENKNIGYYTAVNHAIEIVNQVAETYEQEVCEWVEKSVDSIKLVREPHRLRLFHTEEDRQYCPYCGKKIKIKVVE